MSGDLLSISIVTWRLDAGLFAQVLNHLRAAIQLLAQQRPAAPVRICIVDNGDDAFILRDLLARSGLAPHAELVSPGQNLGYGKAHNLAINASAAKYHLIMNPDVLVAEDALLRAVDFLDSHTDAVALSPYAIDGEGKPAYLCKRYPALLDLALRGFAPGALRKYFSERLDQYENRALVAQDQPAAVDLISGCFMFCRTEVLQKVGGFNPRFFLYFEDFSLSLELKKFGRLMYCPMSCIVHYGGHARKKGLKHILHFATSAMKFYSHYGWKLL